MSVGLCDLFDRIAYQIGNYHSLLWQESWSRNLKVFSAFRIRLRCYVAAVFKGIGLFFLGKPRRRDLGKHIQDKFDICHVIP